jgi:hypothetical protein
MADFSAHKYNQTACDIYPRPCPSSPTGSLIFRKQEGVFTPPSYRVLLDLKPAPIGIATYTLCRCAASNINERIGWRSHSAG